MSVPFSVPFGQPVTPTFAFKMLGLVNIVFATAKPELPMRSALMIGFLLSSTASAEEAVTLGKLSAKYESNGKVAAVSSGIGDRGGVSYGSYQLTSKLGAADRFAKKYYPDTLGKLKAGTDPFTSLWKEMAAKNPETLHKHEHEYIEETHYAPQVKKIDKELKTDLKGRSPTFRDVIWSTAVQHGPNTKIVIDSGRSLIKQDGTIAEVTDEEWIDAIYAERGRKNDAGMLAHFPTNPNQKSLSDRFKNEHKDAIAALKKK